MYIPDDSIDIFLTDTKNITILHITPLREFEIESYKLDKYNIDEYGIGIYDDFDWYYINRYSRCITKIGRGSSFAFSNELYRERRKVLIKEANIGLVKNVQNIISEYD